jgi:hypothetical protein
MEFNPQIQHPTTRTVPFTNSGEKAVSKYLGGNRHMIWHTCLSSQHYIVTKTASMTNKQSISWQASATNCRKKWLQEKWSKNFVSCWRSWWVLFCVVHIFGAISGVTFLVNCTRERVDVEKLTWQSQQDQPVHTTCNSGRPPHCAQSTASSVNNSNINIIANA